ncbi:hypothetical protein C5S29_11860 [ANME-1 cluster archaeon GoMg3.2]|nr:hypothetical protein [ANME-1 cluster archaeon GoMg3.2]
MSNVKIFWDPKRSELNALGTKKYLRATDETRLICPCPFLPRIRAHEVLLHNCPLYFKIAINRLEMKKWKQ